MLELLAGPFTIRTPDGTALDIAEGQGAQYDDAIGLVSVCNSLGYCVTQLDGVTYGRAQTAGFGDYVLDLQSPSDWLVKATLFKDQLFKFDRKTGIPGALVIDSGVTAGVVWILSRAADRFLFIIGQYVRNRPLDLSAEEIDEYALIGAGGLIPSLSRTRRANVLCLAYPTGEVVYYDYVNRVQVPGSAFLGANNGAWYSPMHDVFVVLTGTSTKQISVFANSVLPTVISNPVASPALTRGRRSTISVTLTGANGDASSGELVDWSLSGPGALLATQSESDAHGIASVGYIAPLTLSTDPTFTATVTL